jgi:hypothetical protein
MGLLDIFQDCFGLTKGRNAKSSFVIDGVSPNGYDGLSKTPEMVVKSKDSCASSQYTPGDVWPKSSHQALCVVSKGTYKVVDDIAYPSIQSPNEIIIQTKAVGLNPIDWKAVDYNFCMPSFPWINGRELAGTVVQVGSNVEKFQVGDDVWASKLPCHRFEIW